MDYHITEIFVSIDGEVNAWGQGHPTTFIRLKGCNLRCPWCDTKYSWNKRGGLRLSAGLIHTRVLYTDKVTITGGEPLLHDLEDLVHVLSMNETLITIETNGTKSVFNPWIWRPNVGFVIDLKPPSSGCTEDKIAWEWIRDMLYLPNTRLKIVVSNEDDLDFLHTCVYKYRLAEFSSKFAFSPVVGYKKSTINASNLLVWMLDNGYERSILNVQLHKLIDMK